MRSPRLSIAADIAETRSSSTPCCRAEAMINPSTETTAEASISGAAACILRRRSTIRSERDFAIKGLLNVSLPKFTILQFSRECCWTLRDNLTAVALHVKLICSADETLFSYSLYSASDCRAGFTLIGHYFSRGRGNSARGSDDYRQNGYSWLYLCSTGLCVCFEPNRYMVQYPDVFPAYR